MLNEYDFQSIFKNEFNYFIKFKRSSGLKYQNEIYRLKSMDNILFNLKLKSKKITRDTFYELTKRNGMIGENYARYYGIIMEFCKFLISNGYRNIYYENKKFKVTNNYKPIIFNDEEINLLFGTMNQYIKQDEKHYCLYYTYSILIRLLYACGLRISEAVQIKITDIDFKNNTITIVNSKRNVSRIIVFSNSMKQCLNDYINTFKIIDGLLFQNNGKPIVKESLRTFYKKVLSIANLNVNAHLHDLRHIFCNKAFNQMLEKGYDENVVIVYLYKYMGHKYITETEYYLHFTNYNKKKLLETNDTFSKNLYEGVDLSDE